MAVYDLEEQEQISQLKAWWERYGTMLTTVAVVFAVSMVGWRVYEWYRLDQSTRAATQYLQIEAQLADGELQALPDNVMALIEAYPATYYAQAATLLAARALLDAGKGAQAQPTLEWLVANGGEPVLRDLGRLRLALVLAAGGDTEAALQQLQAAPVSAHLKPRFADVEGDILAARGKLADARSAWQGALDALSAQNPQGQQGQLAEAIRIKIDTTGEPQS